MRRLLCLAAFAAASVLAQPADFDARVVEDSSGNPLASVEVRFHRTGQRELAADLDSDRQGLVRASGLPPGDYAVDFVKPNYITAGMKLRLPVTGVFVRLVRYASISGQALDSEGRPVPGRILEGGGRTIGGARVAILAKTATGAFKKAREIELGDEGRYRVYDLPPGEYTVGLWYDALRDGSGVLMYPDTARPRVFQIAGGEEFRDVNFQLVGRSTYKVTGKVVLPNANAQATVALGLPDQPIPIAHTLTDQGSGAFTFERIPSGAYDLYVAGPFTSYRAFDVGIGPEPFYGHARVVVGSQDVAGLEPTIGPGRNLAVKLAARGGGKLPEGCPPSARLELEVLDPWGLYTPDAPPAVFGKETTIPGLPPARLRLTLDRLGAACYQPDPPTVDLSREAAAPVALELAPAGSIRGVLRGAADSTGFTIVLLEAGDDAAAQFLIATPAADGKFAFDGIRPGRYRIAAQPPGARSRWVADTSRMIEIQIPGGVPTDIELPAPPPAGDRP